MTILLTCENPDCAIVFESDRMSRKFCSHSCAAKVNNSGVRRHGESPNECLWCGRETASYRNTYCSHKCRQEHGRQEKIDRWLSGEWDGSDSSGRLSRLIREYVIDSGEGTCSSCGYHDVHPVSGLPIIDVEHKDGDPRNNKPNNVILLCPNCHRKTETWGRNGNRTH